LILIAGLGGDVTTWQLQTPALSDHFRVIVFDNRDAGRSSLATGAYTTADMAEDTAGLMDGLGIDKAHVLGASMGGTIAQELALAYPDRIQKLILYCTMGQFGRFHLSPIHVWKELRRQDAGGTLFAKDVLNWCMTQRFLMDSEAVDEMVELFCNPPYPVPPEAYCRQADALCRFDRLDRLKNLQTPTLVLVGAEDILTPPWAARELASQIPDAELKVLDRGGHCLLWEIPEEFNRTVIGFLTS
jgi:pimeloyl-ACP methyl ester carboxylesterase